MGQWAGLLFLPLLIVPLVAAYVAHNASGAVGNPFKGLVWGPKPMIFGAWILGLAVSYFAVLISIGIGLQQLDLSMSSYLDFVLQQNAAQGNDIPESAYGFLRISGMITIFGSPLVFVWFAAAMACLGQFPWLGWFTRRMLVYGRFQAGVVLAALYALTAMPAGLLDNPQLGEIPVLLRVALMGITGAVGVPLALWLFYRTKSAVIPAVAQASIQMGAAGAMPVLGGGDPLITPPSGLLLQAVILLAGIALWVWKEPRGEDLTVAAVAFDGTPLTPAMVASFEPGEVHGADPDLIPAPADPEPGTPDE